MSRDSIGNRRGPLEMQIAADDLDDLSAGAVFLATGGGGDPYVAKLATYNLLSDIGPAEMIAVDDLDDDAFVVAVGNVGAPTVSLELLPSVQDPAKVVDAFEKLVGRRVDAVVPFEIGGGNSLIPIMAAVSHGVPIIDGDGMGRALPAAQMMTYPIAGVRPTPAVALDYMGNTASLSTDSTDTYERHIRSLAMAMGGMILAAEHPMSGRQLKESVVPGTVSFSMAVGRTLREYRGAAGRILGPLRELFATSLYGGMFHIFSGKVVDFASRIEGGFDVGRAVIEPFDQATEPLTVNVRNEYLSAQVGEQVLVSVPDLITILDSETSTPINTERLRYGQRVTVLGTGCPAFYRREAAMRVVAPSCFGLPFDYVPVEDLQRYHRPLPGCLGSE